MDTIDNERIVYKDIHQTTIKQEGLTFKIDELNQNLKKIVKNQ